MYIQNYYYCFWFQFGRKTIEEEYKWNVGGSTADVGVTDEDSSYTDKDYDGTNSSTGGDLEKPLANGTSVISREDLILVPDPEHNLVRNNHHFVFNSQVYFLV